MNTPIDKFIDKKVQEFYSVFAGNKFEESCKIAKKNEDGKFTPYFMDDWIRETLQAQKAEEREKLYKFAADERDKAEKIWNERKDKGEDDDYSQGYFMAMNTCMKFLESLTEVKDSVEEIPQMEGTQEALDKLTIRPL